MAPIGGFADLVRLVVRGVLLMLGEHPHVRVARKAGGDALVVTASGSVAMFFLCSFV